MLESDEFMIPKRSYLLKAAYEWVVDSEMTPYLLVDATEANVVVPTQFVQDGKIVLNVSMNAVRHLLMDGDAVSFEARFGGKPMQVFVPIKAALALYAKENGDGLFFPEENFPDNLPPSPSPEEPKAPTKPFTLRVVK